MKSQSTLPVLVAALWIAGCGAPATPAEEPSAAEATSPAAPAVAPPAENPAASDGAETAGDSEPEPKVEELSWSELDRRGDEHLKAGRFDEELAPMEVTQGVKDKATGETSDVAYDGSCGRTLVNDDGIRASVCRGVAIILTDTPIIDTGSWAAGRWSATGRWFMATSGQQGKVLLIDMTTRIAHEIEVPVALQTTVVDIWSGA